jgi:MYXO-CTERM domain-containing protein
MNKFWGCLLLALVSVACSGEPRALSTGEATAREWRRETGATPVLSTRGERHWARLTASGLRIGGARSAPEAGAVFLAAVMADAKTPNPRASVRHVRDGLAEVDRGWAREQWKSVAKGVEQTWVFDARPSQHEVVIHIPVERAQFLGKTDRGLLFRTNEGEIVSYSDAQWIDARGSRTHLSSEFADGSIRLRVWDSILSASAYPAVLDPVIGVESTQAPDQLVEAQGAQRYFARMALGTIAPDAKAQIMVWNDSREGVVDAVYCSLNDNPNGPFSERAGKRLGYGRLTGTAVRPAVAFAAGVYLVAWATYDTVYVVRVDQQGTVLDTTPRTLVTGGQVDTASVASHGDEFLVVWVDKSTGNGDLRGIRITPQGDAIDAEPIALTEDAFPQSFPSLRESSDGYWVIFEEDREGDQDIGALRLNPDGTPVDATTIPVVSAFADQTQPDLAFDATGKALAVWGDAGSAAVHGAALTPELDGSVSVGAAARISIGSGERAPRIIHNGSSFQIAWISAQPGAAAPQVALLATSTPQRADGVTLDVGSSTSVDITVNDFGGVHAIWDSTNNSISGAIYRKNGTTSNNWNGSPVLVSESAETQVEPRLANNNARFLATWIHPGVAGDELHAARINALGEFEDAAPIRLTFAEYDIGQVGVYSNSTDFLVLWNEATLNANNTRTWRLYSRIVYGSGAPDTYTNELLGGGYFPELADVWMDYESLPWRYILTFLDGDVLYNAAITTAGRKGNSIFVYEHDSLIDASAVRASAEHIYYLSQYGYLYQVDQSLAGGSGSLGRPLIDLHSPDATFDLTGGARDALALHDPVEKTVSAYVTGGGMPTWSLVLASDVPSDAAPQITRITDGYLIAWNQAGGIVGMRVSADGKPLDPKPATLSQEPTTEKLGDVFTDFLDRALVAYSRPMWVSGINATRIAARPIDFRYDDGAALGEPCETGFDCDTGYCSDGVCCDSPCGVSASDDCQACSQNTGASADGVCTVFAAGTVCRPWAGPCDREEICGGGAECPANEFQPAGYACGEPAAGPCDLADECPGESAECSARGVADAQTMCRSSRGACDADDRCDGVSIECEDGLQAAGYICRQTSGSCDVTEACDGESYDCPSDGFAEAGTECHVVDGTCDRAGVCSGDTGTCTATDTEPCPDPGAGGAAGADSDGGTANGAGGSFGGTANGAGGSFGGTANGGRGGSSSPGEAGDGGAPDMPVATGGVVIVAGNAGMNSAGTSNPSTGPESSGCACRTAGNRRPGAHHLGWLVAAVALVSRRRRRRSTAGHRSP